MASLDNLTAKILSDGQARAKEIIDAAKAEAEAKSERELSDTAAEGEKIVSGARYIAARTAEQLVQGKALSIRDENLGAKREMLDKLFLEALKRLNGMSKDEYLEYLCNYLSRLDLDGEELVLPSKYGVIEIDGINSRLQKNGKKGNLVMNADGKRRIDGGFVLIKEGIEQNHTFESLIEYYRDELESEVLKILYA